MKKNLLVTRKSNDLYSWFTFNISIFSSAYEHNDVNSEWSPDEGRQSRAGYTRGSLERYFCRNLEAETAMRQGMAIMAMYSTFRANSAKTGGLIFVTLISFPKLNFLYLT